MKTYQEFVNETDEVLSKKDREGLYKTKLKNRKMRAVTGLNKRSKPSEQKED